MITIARVALAAAILAAPIAVIAAPANAATAHNSQAGGYGSSANVNDSTVSSPRVKHAAKHHDHA